MECADTGGTLRYSAMSTPGRQQTRQWLVKSYHQGVGLVRTAVLVIYCVSRDNDRTFGHGALSAGGR
jgi:hypothetical protein